MIKRLVIGIGLIVLAVGAYQLYRIAGSLSMPSSPEEIAEIRAKAAQQREDVAYRPESLPALQQAPNPFKNVYFGDLHVHTNLSADAFLFGNRFDMDAAYRFAQGQSMELRSGERVELSRPLDFVALTDHAETFGRVDACLSPELSEGAREACSILIEPTFVGFMKLRGRAETRPFRLNLDAFDGDAEREREFAAATWKDIVDAAERHNKPGVFTAFAGYEYSPALIDRGKHHRNIIFRSSDTPKFAVSAADAASEIDLWRQLAETCSGDCEFFTIPHNPNKSWGLAFASHTIDDVPYTDSDWATRRDFEPLVEMFQIKGNSECVVGFGATDEECSFEQFFPTCDEGETTSCIHPTSMVRDGLKKGLVLEDTLGFNPLQFGFIGSTDTHNSNPGDTEEWDYRGSTTFASSPASQRLNVSNVTGIRNNNPGGLAAVWAAENTRDALFDAMKRREVYATSGTRIKLRFFAGFNFPDLGAEPDMKLAYSLGVPMGSVLNAVQDGSPSFFVWATQDPLNAPLAKIQIIKAWRVGDETFEQVFDVHCADSTIDPEIQRCRDNGASVNPSDCRWSTERGDSEARVLWRDPGYDASHDAFYYARVVQNPTCRWTTYDSLRLGVEPPSDVPELVTEMAWSSPIWLTARASN